MLKFNSATPVTQTGDYPVGALETLARKQAELDLLKQRESQLNREIASIQESFRRRARAG